MPAETARLQVIYRYPVKGLSAESLQRAELAVGETVPGDRLYAVENGPSGFDPAAPRYAPKQRYLMLQRNQRLAMLRSRFDQASHTLVIESEAREAARGDLRTPEGRAAIERFVATFCANELRGPPKVLHSPGVSFSDFARKVLSIINLASVATVETNVAARVQPLCFRGNLPTRGCTNSCELDPVGRAIAI